MPIFRRDHIDFHYLERGSGIPFFFQHGLGGDAESVFALLEPPPGFRLIALDFRAHGQTEPLGNVEKLGFSPFANDLIALMDHLQLARAIIGGTSMGAGVSLNCAVRFPDRLLALVLQRPAWLERPHPQNVAVFGLIAKLLRDHGPQAGLSTFLQSDLYQQIAAESKDSADSLLAQFMHPRALETVAKFERIPQDTPCADRTQWRQIKVPTLVLANRRDPIHPFAYGQTLAQEIPGAQLRELTPKSVNLSRYTHEVRSYVGAFLQAHLTAVATTS